MSKLLNDIQRLIADQTASWETARKNYAALKEIQHKSIDFGCFTLEVQFNLERARSTTASMEKVEERPCFLCAENRPAEQKSVGWKEYEIRVNPYPVFSPHLTIPAVGHIPQRLTGKIRDMVELSGEMPGLALTFNGARSGASAPDHFHFQAVTQDSLPAIRELTDWKSRCAWLEKEEISVWGIDDYLRPAILIEGRTIPETVRTAETIFACLKPIMNEPDEAQVNALAWWDCEKYRIVFFPRTAHRPRQFYADGPEQFRFSPGAVDMGGVVITVRKPDFERVSVPLLTDLFSQVVPAPAQWEQIKTELSPCLTKSPK